MNISGPTSITGQSYILSGYYSWSISGSVRPKLFEFSSPTYPIGNFIAPYDAKLSNVNSRTGNANIAVGRRLASSSDTISSNRSGALYYYTSPSLIGVCHGYGRNFLTYYSGYNFYNAFYPAGYYLPPYGETVGLYTLNKDGYDNLKQGACATLSVTEYNEQFGIVSEVASDASASANTLTPGLITPVMSIAEVCPEGTIAVSTYYDELNLKRIPGTASQITAPTFHNHNPIPTSLDNYDNWVGGRYKYNVDSQNKKNDIVFGPDQRPIASYPASGTNNSRLNNLLCPATLYETSVLAGIGQNGMQMLQAPDTEIGAIGSQASSAGQNFYYYWQFTFRENAETLPFMNDFKQIRPGVTFRTISEGTQLFEPVLSSEDMYWQNRQCPETVDFLPWNFGASIYACPSQHFDIPYYASLKRFGFYGVRFLNSCSRLNLTNSGANGVPNSQELPPQTGVLALDIPDTEPDGIDDDGNWSFSMYDNLLRIANAEERYSNMYALNKGFFLWANSGCVSGDPIWPIVSNYVGFVPTFKNLLAQFQNVYQNGLSSFVSGTPSIMIQQGQASATFTIIDSGAYSDILLTNDAYNIFRGQLTQVLDSTGMVAWNNLENKYAYYISNCNGGVNEAFYANIISGRQQRMMTRYFENIIRGNPIDLFPLNHITFATDTARDYLESTGWSRLSVPFGKSSHLPPIQRRYFEGAYGNSSASSGISNILSSLSLASNSSFYPGFFNGYGIGKDLATPTYTSVLSGLILDTAGRKFSTSGWLAAGYHEIGHLDSNFSCFTPIFIQQPLPNVFCKIGQHPTLRVLAVDYHAIPEDKISYRYPEIVYWMSKLKVCDSNFNNLYPLQYKWFRVPKTSVNTFDATANFSLAEFSNPTGNWCAMEGDKSTCTIIHPLECRPQYTSNNTFAPNYTFIQGVKYGIDDKYSYYCLVIGRFGVRVSEPTNLSIENWLRFDISVKNGMNVIGKVGVNFIVNDYNGQTQLISFKAGQAQSYEGFQVDKYAIPESTVQQKIPPPNAGFGDVFATRFIGTNGWVGATRSYAPDTLYDTRGLRENWGTFLDYGTLIPFSKILSQTEGNLLYGYSHLPVCTQYQMNNGQHGVRAQVTVNGANITHWSLGQQAFASLDSTAGMKWSKINGVGSLYPPSTNITNVNSPGLGIGHWQWGNNLGAIKRFGWASRPQDGDLVLLGQGVSQGNVDPILFNQIKKHFIYPETLGGTNCGYTKYGMGRNMLYYIESFDRFYSICDPIKKKNVQDISFMCPGLRSTNSAIQYFWLGQPNNTYLERRPMYGPYAYQWRVRRHNRDRNGNGISQSFYSMNYEAAYSLMYDAPATYGLYLKRSASPAYINQVQQVKAYRKKVIGSIINITDLRLTWFGQGGGEGGVSNYGWMFSCDSTQPYYNIDMCNYVSAAQQLAMMVDFTAYSCPQDRLQKGACFDPCISLRYSAGFFPGGKSQDMFGFNSTVSSNLPIPTNIRLIPVANYLNDMLIVDDEPSKTDWKTWFRSPVNTPHARIWRGLQDINGSFLAIPQPIVGMSPCQDGGTDHCNYNTPTIHLDNNTSMLLGQSTSFTASVGYAANIYSAFLSQQDNS